MIESILDRLFEFQEIRDGCEAGSRTDSPVYLKRYFLVKNDFDADRSAGVHGKPRFSLTWHRKTNGRQLYLHHILRSDADPELHDHPWGFVSVILWRGYMEQIDTGFASYQRHVSHAKDFSRKWPGMVLVRAAEHRHRLHLIDDVPAWSLVFTTSKKRTWGFWRLGEFIPWRLFVSRKCEERAHG